MRSLSLREVAEAASEGYPADRELMICADADDRVIAFVYPPTPDEQCQQHLIGWVVQRREEANDAALA